MTPDTQIFLQLLRSGMWDEPVGEFPAMPNWEVIDRMAEQQSVRGTVADGVKKLSKQMAPQELGQRLNWMRIPATLEKTALVHNENLVRLTTCMEKNGIRYRLMKGQGCAALYPQPLHRQAGDIDLFVGEEQYEAAKGLLAKCNFCLIGESVCDAHYKIGKTDLELHRKEGILYWRAHNRRFQQICREEEWKDPETFEVNGQRIAIFNPTFNAFYTFVHLYHHFLQIGIGLRQVCDWSLMLKHNERAIDWTRLAEYLRTIHAQRAWAAFLGLAVEHLGLRLDPAVVPAFRYNRRDPELILNDILRSGNFGQHGESATSRRFHRGIAANTKYFFKTACRLLRIGRFGRREAIAYPTWKLFCEKGVLRRYMRET